MTLSEAKEFMALLEVERRVIETSELAVRIEVLERSAEGSGQAPEIVELGRRIRRCVQEGEQRP
jgi:hypothetical protein